MVQLVMENIRLAKRLILLTFYILKVIIKETSILTILFHDIQARRTCHAESKGTVRNPESQKDEDHSPAFGSVPGLHRTGGAPHRHGNLRKSAAADAHPEFCHHLPVPGLFLPAAPAPDHRCGRRSHAV